jgi:hypothetical protein
VISNSLIGSPTFRRHNCLYFLGRRYDEQATSKRQEARWVSCAWKTIISLCSWPDITNRSKEGRSVALKSGEVRKWTLRATYFYFILVLNDCRQVNLLLARFLLHIFSFLKMEAQKTCFCYCCVRLLGFPRDRYLGSPLTRWFLSSTYRTENTVSLSSIVVT